MPNSLESNFLLTGLFSFILGLIAFLLGEEMLAMVLLYTSQIFNVLAVAIMLFKMYFQGR